MYSHFQGYTVEEEYEAQEPDGPAPAMPAPKFPEINSLDSSIVYRSQVMHDLLRDVLLYADCEANVMVLGETGTGKESIARLLHNQHGRRVRGPFVPVNCGAIPDGLFESEFFGHTAGAFTGAAREHAGYFEQANGGTLFLDEIGELPIHQQVKLLRILEQRRVTPLGSRKSVALDFRLVSATNRDLRAMVEAGQFRADLYYRLAVAVFRLPNLDERGPLDKLAIFEAVLDRVARRDCSLIAPVPGWVSDLIVNYRFEGNIRELINIAERIAITYRAGMGWDRARIGALFEAARNSAPAAAPRSTPAPVTSQYDAERQLILSQLEANAWQRKATAAALGISRKVLWEKMHKFKIYEHPALRATAARRRMS